jgi:predicted DNA-binding transcriptional regulator AlpA
MAADGRFPKPIKIAGNRNGWASDRVEVWQAERERQAAAEKAAD